MTRTSIARGMLALSLAGLALAAGNAMAESQYGSGTGTITAQAKVNLSVTVPKLILLRVGSTNTTVDTVTWTSSLSIPGVPTTPVVGNNTNVDWSGAAPTVTATSAANVLNVYAWTNAGAGTINCAMGAWAPLTGGPTNADFTVATTGTLPHPGANLGACASTSFNSNVAASGTWTYTLGGSAASWVANTYTNTITYTAQGI
ncbi:MULTISPECIES: hypothetical protein [unclassified Variovorax]|jgi:hypothetical protein|uniref:hypothetical protein n=1 Tax=unclassified Variovorax TaxID=663243 RepID=UPI000F7F8A26|nr:MULTISPECIES: hypothetical protein [unclassified Variovorax]RSZ32247.1 hypothetical protein EJO70_30115 [Variovorax sp. 553]RSZ32591.1 hypothetical protein EJO71_30415 [Variovorax sp. 679]